MSMGKKLINSPVILNFLIFSIIGILSLSILALSVNVSAQRDASVTANLSKEPIPSGYVMNINISGYHVPSLTPEQLSYTGAIAGNIRTYFGYMASVNVSLWGDGSLVNRSDNPQVSAARNYSGTSVDYLFDHVAPGNYTVRVDYFAGGNYNDTVTVVVGTKPMRADIVLSKAFNRPTTWPVVNFTPSIGEFSQTPTAAPVIINASSTANPGANSTSTAAPAPLLPGVIMIVIIGSVAFIRNSLRNRNR